MNRSSTWALAAVSVFAMVLASPSVYGKPPQQRAASERTKTPKVVPPTANGSSRPKTKTTSKKPKKARATTTKSSAVQARRGASAKPIAQPDLLAFAAPAETKGKDAKPRAKKKKGDAAGESGKKPKRRSSGEGGKKVSIEDEFLIEGKLEKPSAYYILRRSQGDYDWARLDAKFLPLVLESVQDPLF